MLTKASSDAHTSLLIMLVLKTGLKKAELLGLRVGDFDFSDKYQPQLYVRHTGRQVFKDRRLKLPTQIISAFDDYVRQYEVTDVLFPRTPRLITQVLNAAGQRAGITKPVSVSILRDMFVVRSVKRGMPLDDALAKLGMAKMSYADARRKYGRLTSEAL